MTTITDFVSKMQILANDKNQFLAKEIIENKFRLIVYRVDRSWDELKKYNTSDFTDYDYCVVEIATGNIYFLDNRGKVCANIIGNISEQDIIQKIKKLYSEHVEAKRLESVKKFTDMHKNMPVLQNIAPVRNLQREANLWEYYRSKGNWGPDWVDIMNGIW